MIDKCNNCHHECTSKCRREGCPCDEHQEWAPEPEEAQPLVTSQCPWEITFHRKEFALSAQKRGKENMKKHVLEVIEKAIVDELKLVQEPANDPEEEGGAGGEKGLETLYSPF